ncbi:hypothetical protein L2E82_48732 [Cichorium intybus]|uniref:Uncharacterized protein n=1 Tax=Cichorium intybus TaxID=13427 RepID=A0ACB8YYV1_CICIN|nr:hypothetical protein L2E82_48732 [Cichorium intybus]
MAESSYETGLRRRSNFITGGYTNVGSETAQEHVDGNEQSSTGNKGTTTTKVGGASVAVVTDEGLNNHVGDRTARPSPLSPTGGGIDLGQSVSLSRGDEDV